MGLGNNSIQGVNDGDPLKSNNYCFDTANGAKPGQVGLKLLYSDFQMEDNPDGRRHVVEGVPLAHG